MVNKSLSTSKALTFSPPRMIMSGSRPTITRLLRRPTLRVARVVPTVVVEDRLAQLFIDVIEAKIWLTAEDLTVFGDSNHHTGHAHPRNPPRGNRSRSAGNKHRRAL